MLSRVRLPWQRRAPSANQDRQVSEPPSQLYRIYVRSCVATFSFPGTRSTNIVIVADHISGLLDWYDFTARVKTYSCSRAVGLTELLVDTSSRKDDIDVDKVREYGPTQPDQRVPCSWGTCSAVTTYKDAVSVLDDAVNRFTDLCRVSFSESGLRLSGPRGARIKWNVREILMQKISASLFEACKTLAARLYELIDDYNRLSEVLGSEHAMEALFERVQEPHGLVSAVDAILQQKSVQVICAAVHRADKLADNVQLSSPDKTAELETVKQQLKGVDYRTMEEARNELKGQYKLPKPSLIMAALASTGRLWNTDPETTSILVAMCPGGEGPLSATGEYYPLGRNQRNQLFVRMELGATSRKLLLDGITWVVPAGCKHTHQRMLLFYRKADTAPLRSIGFMWKRSPELGRLTEGVARALLALKEVEKPWGVELHNGLRDCMLRGVSPMGHEVAEVVEVARIAWKTEYCMIDDPAIELVMGAINVTYSFIVEPDNVQRFCDVHHRRCLRMVGAHTTIDGVPLYLWDANRSHATQRGQVGKLVADQEVSVQEDVQRVPVLGHRMGYVREWRLCRRRADQAQSASVGD